MLREGISDDGNVQETLLLATALAVTEGPHAAVLQHLKAEPWPPTEWLKPGDGPLQRLACQSPREGALPEVAGLLDAVLAPIAGLGPIYDVQSGRGYGSPPANARWVASPLGNGRADA